MNGQIMPVYRLRWEDGTERKTDNIEDPKGILQEPGLEFLVDRGREDPSCEVELVGYTG